MYLLKRRHTFATSFLQYFTFHYVSIKTVHLCSHASNGRILHSTMYLLKRRRIENIQVTITFTFHYVSIKTDKSDVDLEVTAFYIPLCIY